MRLKGQTPGLGKYKIRIENRASGLPFPAWLAVDNSLV